MAKAIFFDQSHWDCELLAPNSMRQIRMTAFFMVLCLCRSRYGMAPEASIVRRYPCREIVTLIESVLRRTSHQSAISELQPPACHALQSHRCGQIQSGNVF